MAGFFGLGPGEADRPIDRLLSPVQNFLRIEAAGGILLIIATVAALVWANVPAWQASYEKLWYKQYLTVGVDWFSISLSLNHWVNDGLMVIFFFVVGLEIKRELIVGELASPRKAAIPVAAAIGGVAAPALIFVAFNWGQPGIRGWAIPTATDIAFALGVMAMLGPRVPLSLKVFITAVAIVDDICAVLIIALFYTENLAVNALGVAGLTTVALIVCNILHVRRPSVYVILGLILWLAVLKSGIHATIAGVVLAFTIPSKFRVDGARFLAYTRKALDGYEAAGGEDHDIMTNPKRQRMVHAVEKSCEHVSVPLLRFEHALHPWSSFLIVPIFALANAGVPLNQVEGGLIRAFTTPISLGIIVGLIAGKQIGLVLFSWFAIKLNLGDLPRGVGWKRLWAASWLAGIGFTMSIFIASLGFKADEGVHAAEFVAQQKELLALSKIGILTASLVAGVAGFVLLRSMGTPDGDAAAPGGNA